MKTKRIVALIILAFLVGLIAGVQWQRWRYAEHCAQLGGTISHDPHPVCLLDNDGAGTQDSNSGSNSGS